MNLVVAGAIVLLAALAAALVMRSVRRRLREPLLADTGRASTTLSLVGTAFAVLLAFITLAAFQTYNGAKSGASSEASAVLELFRTAGLFPVAQRDRLRADFVCYGRAVINDEWPAMADERTSPVVDRWIAQYRAQFDRLNLSGSRERLGFQEILADARARTDGRQERLDEATPSVPAPLWIVLILGGLVTIALQIVMADPREGLLMQECLIAGVTLIVSAGLLLVSFLDHPYEGRTGSITPFEMQRTLSEMHEAQPALRVPCDTRGMPIA
jgi:hypothetical protein